MIRYLILVFFFICIQLRWGYCQGQQSFTPPIEKEISNVSGFWLGTYTKYRISKRLFYYGEYHFRRKKKLVQEMAQIYLRFGMTYLVNKQMEITTGVVTPMYWAPEKDRFKPEIDTWVPQYRFWEQLLLVQPLNHFKLYHTFRLEQRWRRDFKEGSPFNLTFRFRYKFTVYHPLNRPVLVPRTLFFSGYNEIFIQAGKTVLYNHFEDNRLFLGLGYIINKNLQVQAGYMWTYRHAGGPYKYEHRHIPRLSFYHNVDFFRKKLEKRKQKPIILNNEF